MERYLRDSFYFKNIQQLNWEKKIDLKYKTPRCIANEDDGTHIYYEGRSAYKGKEKSSITVLPGRLLPPGLFPIVKEGSLRPPKQDDGLYVGCGLRSSWPQCIERTLPWRSLAQCLWGMDGDFLLSSLCRYPCALWAAVIEYQRLGSLWIVEVSLPPCVNTRSKH